MRMIIATFKVETEVDCADEVRSLLVGVLPERYPEAGPSWDVEVTIDSGILKVVQYGFSDGAISLELEKDDLIRIMRSLDSQFRKVGLNVLSQIPVSIGWEKDSRWLDSQEYLDDIGHKLRNAILNVLDYYPDVQISIEDGLLTVNKNDKVSGVLL